MLPFSSIDFFLIAGTSVLLLYILKATLHKVIPFSRAILGLSIFYIVVYYPKPIHLGLFMVYTYFIYYLFQAILKPKNKLLGVLLMLLPMIVFKSNIKVHFYPFDISSFIFFAGLSYVSFKLVSIYLDAKPTDKPVNFFIYLNFLIFTPTLLIGPLDRLDRFTTELKNGYQSLTLTNFVKGWEIIMVGVLYKFVIAELISRYWLSWQDVNSTDLLPMANTMYSYYLYLFFDFAGYSNMAIGLGKMMGIKVPTNFNMPFLSKNPQEFWKRFHISLGDWLKDYFFTPFYKFFSKRKSLKSRPLFRQNISLFATFLLMGCWNGFHANYMLSGAIFGFYSAVHNTYVFYCRKKKKDIVFGNLHPKLVSVISIFIMFNLAAFSIYIFSGYFPFL